VTDDRVTYLTWCLLVEDLDDIGQSTVASSMAYLKYNFFPSVAPFASLSDEERMGLVIETFNSLARDGLADFWDWPVEQSISTWGRPEWRAWIDANTLTASEVEARLRRLVPLWWSRVFGEDFDYSRTDAGEAVFEQWFHHPPKDIALRIGAPAFTDPPEP
jgi:hypothetical protein